VGVETVYRVLLDAWNARDADAFARCFAEDGVTYGFDGSELAGRAAIAEELGRIFRDHETGRYVAIVRSVRSLGDDVALLRAVVGMVPAGRDDLEPQLNAAQTLLVQRHADGWRVVQLQNTQAQYHGRPEAVEELTAELRAARAAGDHSNGA
jgi:uncharacterized protein (TIGR02246 family)